ncbi:hypothetical protein [Streptomyces sp. NPDC094049]|uniref:hypothetical protein n=1 Tax=Streptomyces sp. NPDC094049 TaxID=3154987 RepID=UPI00332DB83F
MQVVPERSLRRSPLVLRRGERSRPQAAPRGPATWSPGDQVLTATATAPLLDDDPAVTAARVTDELGVHRDTAQRALTQLRAQRIADHLTTHPGHTPDQAAQHLGYPAGQVRTATSHALLELRACAAVGPLCPLSGRTLPAPAGEPAEVRRAPSALPRPTVRPGPVVSGRTARPLLIPAPAPSSGAQLFPVGQLGCP